MTILRVACYERVSTDEQAIHGFSIETQIENLTEYCQNEGVKLVGHYVDEGKSGSLPPLKRPALHRLLEDVQAGKIDMILFTKLDRWFRSVKEYFKVQEILDRHQVEWKAIHEDYDTTTANGRMAITIFLAVAENERERTSERVRAIFENKRKHKEACFGGPHKPFGYRKQKDADGINRLVKDPKEEKMCQEFWNILIEHDNFNMAIRHMKDEYGVTKDPKTWRRITTMPFYCGMYDGVEDFCEPYITKADWNKVQDGIASRKQDTKPKRTYMFSGLMKCPQCGSILSPSYKNSEYKGVITVYNFYRCRHKNTKCGYKRSLTELMLERELLTKLPKLVEHEIASVELEAENLKSKPRYNLAGLRERLRTCNASYMAGNKTDEEYIEESAELKKLIAAAEQEAPTVERDLTPLKELLEGDFFTIYSALGLEEKRQFWRNIIDEIVLDDNRVSNVIFKYR